MNATKWTAQSRGYKSIVNMSEGAMAEIVGPNHAATAALVAAAPELLSALDDAEAFIAGFEDDEMQEGVNEVLWTIRAVMLAAGMSL